MADPLPQYMGVPQHHHHQHHQHHYQQQRHHILTYENRGDYQASLLFPWHI